MGNFKFICLIAFNLLFLSFSALAAEDSVRFALATSVEGDSLIKGGVSALIESSKDGSDLTLKVTSVNTKENFRKISFSIKSPIDKGEDKSSIASTLDGLKSSTTIKFGFMEMIGDGGDADLSKVSEKVCSSSNISAKDCSPVVAAKANPDLYDYYLNDVPVNQYLYGFNLEFGEKKFDYIDEENFSAISDEKYSESADVFFGRYFDGIGGYGIIGAKYQNFYQDNSDKGALCPAVDSGSYLHCLSGVIGLPDNKIQQLFYLKFGAQFSSLIKSNTPRFGGVVLQVSYDKKSDLLGVEIPIYLLGDVNGSYTGGVKFGWNDEDNEIGFGLFIGGNFSP